LQDKIDFIVVGLFVTLSR